MSRAGLRVDGKQQHPATLMTETDGIVMASWNGKRTWHILALALRTLGVVKQGDRVQGWPMSGRSESSKNNFKRIRIL